MNLKYKRYGFTILELVFVIVIMGILGKFGANFLAQAYSDFIYSKINNSLQAQSEMAVESISRRLESRIKSSTIRRKSSDDSFVSFRDIENYGKEYNILEWIACDIDGFRGDSQPLWSGIIDLDLSDKTSLISPETNATALNNLIKILSHNSGTDINDSAIYFNNSDNDINLYGWDGAALTEHNNSRMHPISVSQIKDSNNSKFEPNLDGNFTGVEISEYYQLSWTAYAIKFDVDNNKLILYYDYQPWKGESYKNAKNSILMENISDFEFTPVSNFIKIRVCVKSKIINGNTDGAYSICKEKFIL